MTTAHLTPRHELHERAARAEAETEKLRSEMALQTRIMRAIIDEAGVTPEQIRDAVLKMVGLPPNDEG